MRRVGAGSGWWLLGSAVAVDIVGAVLLREADGLSRPWLLVTAYLLWMAAIVLLGTALRVLPLSVGYPVFIGLGGVGVYLWARFGYGEAMPAAALAGLVLVILGTVLVSERRDDP